MCIFIPELSSEHQTHLLVFLLDIFMCIFHRDLKFKMLKNNSTCYLLNLLLYFCYSSLNKWYNYTYSFLNETLGSPWSLPLQLTSHFSLQPQNPAQCISPPDANLQAPPIYTSIQSMLGFDLGHPFPNTPRSLPSAICIITNHQIINKISFRFRQFEYSMFMCTFCFNCPCFFSLLWDYLKYPCLWHIF